MFDFDAFWHACLFESAGDERALFADVCSPTPLLQLFPFVLFFFPFSAVLQPDAARLG